MRWTGEMIHFAAALHRNGESYDALAKRFSVTRGSIAGMASRNRDLFPIADKAAEAEIRDLRRKQRKPWRFEWTPEIRRLARDMWRNGHTSRAIAAAIGCSHVTVARYALANPKDFLPRGERQRKKPVKASARLASLALPARDEPKAGTGRDLSQYALSGVKPSTLGSVKNGQCKFPLVAFEAEDGPDVPCCGAEALPGKSWCNAHYRVVFPGRAS